MLLQQFSSGEVRRLCDCGCNSYDLHVPDGAAVERPSELSERGGCAFELEFNTREWGKTVSFTLFIDAKGNLAGIDVDYCGNSYSMPEHVELVEPPFHVRGELAHAAQPSVAAGAPQASRR